MSHEVTRIQIPAIEGSIAENEARLAVGAELTQTMKRLEGQPIYVEFSNRPPIEPEWPIPAAGDRVIDLIPPSADYYDVLRSSYSDGDHLLDMVEICEALYGITNIDPLNWARAIIDLAAAYEPITPDQYNANVRAINDRTVEQQITDAQAGVPVRALVPAAMDTALKMYALLDDVEQHRVFDAISDRVTDWAERYKTLNDQPTEDEQVKAVFGPEYSVDDERNIVSEPERQRSHDFDPGAGIGVFTLDDIDRPTYQGPPLVGTLTNEQHQALTRWLQEAAPALGVADWRIDASIAVISGAEEHGSTLARSWISTRDREWSLIITDELLKFEESYVRSTLAHEAAHCHIEPLADLIEQRQVANSPLHHAQMEKEIEHICQRFGELMAPMLPPVPACLHGSMTMAEYRFGAQS